jgi:hypothetical protein
MAILTRAQMTATDRVREVSRLQDAQRKGTPFIRYEFVAVRFETANADVKVPHKLQPASPRDVFYQVVRANRPTQIYDMESVGGVDEFRDAPLPTGLPFVPWTKSYIVLRSTTVPCNVTLLLGLARREDIPPNA